MLSVPDSIVFRQNDPSFCAHHRKPFRVLCVSREVIVVNLNERTGASKSVSDLVLSQGAVDKEDKLRRL